MLLLMDGDVLCYNACENKWKFKYPGFPDKHVHLNADGSKAELVFTKAEEQRYLEKCWENFNTILREIKDTVFATEHLMAVKSEHNFRDEIYDMYKASRKNKPKDSQTAFVPILRQLAIHEGLAVEAKGREADDMLRIWSCEAKIAGDPFVVATNDKDMKCISGLFYDMKKKELLRISEEEATRHFYEQLLKGDPVDDIPGLPGIGPKKATGMLATALTETEFQEIVVGAYLAAFDEDWHGQLLSNGKMLYLQQHPEDYFKISQWPIVQELL